MATRDKLKAWNGEQRRLKRPSAKVLSGLSEGVIRFALGAVLSGADLPGGYAPFGVAFVGASGSGINGLCAVLGAIFGSLSFRGLEGGLRDAAAAVLVFSVAFAFFDIKLYHRTWFMPLATGVMVAVTGFVSLRTGWLRTSGVACYLTASLLAGAAVYFNRIALTARELPKGELPTNRQTVALLLFGVTLLMSLAGVTLLDSLSVGCVLAGVTVLCAGNVGGLGTGAAVGVCAGLAMDLSLGTPLYSLAMGFSGLFAGAFRRQGRLFVALAYVLADGVVALWLWDTAPGAVALLYETFAASVIFVTLPERLFLTLAARTAPGSREGGEQRKKAYVKERLEKTAEAFRSVHDNLRDAFHPEGNSGEDPSQVCRRAAERVCVHCALRDACWQRGYQATTDALNHGLSAMLERGKGKAADLPEWFSSRCIRLPQLLEAINEELSGLLYRRRYQNRLQESRAAVCRQYGQLSQVLEEAALELSQELTPEPVRERRLRQHLAALEMEGESAVFCDEHGRLRAELLLREPAPLLGEESRKSLSALLGVPLRPGVQRPEKGKTRLVFTQAEPLAVTAGVAAKKRDGETVSGDAGAWFKGEDGMLYLLLCDGMGSGPEAGRESDLAIRLLEKFLRAGVPPQAALKTLNSALALRAEAEGGFTTVDLCCLDLFTGAGTVYKYGAAPTYIKKGDTVLRVTGATLPAGMAAGERVEPDATPFQLEPGDCAVMVTDGVTDGEEDDWFKGRLAEFDGASPKELARVLLEQSETCGASPDDRTVMVLQLICRGN